MLEVASLGHLDELTLRVRRLGQDPLAHDRRTGLTALHEAARGGHANVVQYLLDSCDADVRARDFCGRTAMHLAA